MTKNLRSDALKIFKSALEAVNPETLVRQNLQTPGDPLRRGAISQKLKSAARIFVIGAGKAAAPMAAACEAVFGGRLTAGVIIVKDGHALPLKGIKSYEAGHPVPDDRTLKATQSVFNLLTGLNEDDLVIALLSGGGSSLLELPAVGLSLDDLRQTTSTLLACGAAIAEINAVRKHLSQVKGGQLLRAAGPATVITLAISDVIGDDPSAIASGPTVPDLTTFATAWQIIAKYSLEKAVPRSCLEHLQRGLRGEIPDTPKPGDPIFGRSSFYIIGNNKLFLKAAEAEALALGYQAAIITDSLQGEAREQGRRLASLLKASPAADKPVCLLAGGETTVTLKELVVQAPKGGFAPSLPASGQGGRNQELALAAAIELDEMNVPSKVSPEGTASPRTLDVPSGPRTRRSSNCLLLSAGSDGTDGPTNAAGAFADETTIARASALRLDAADHLTRHDSYHFFQPLHDLIITGPTLTNVMDLVVMLKEA